MNDEGTIINVRCLQQEAAEFDAAAAAFGLERSEAMRELMAGFVDATVHHRNDGRRAGDAAPSDDPAMTAPSSVATG